MDIDDVNRVCKLIRSLCPSQKWEPETPAVWQPVLANVRLTDALEAVRILGMREDYISPKGIVSEAKRIRRERLEHSDLVLPDVDPDDVTAWLAARRAGIAAMADGTLTALPATPDDAIDGRLRAALPAMFHRPPHGLPADYGDWPRPKAINPPREVSPSEAARIEAERARQLAALAALEDTYDPAQAAS